jgi:hypothetical protein
MKSIIIGEYNRYGYHVWDANGGPIEYAAGNSQYDSDPTVDPGTPGALPLRTIRSNCIRTVRDIVAEVGGIFGGIERGKE